MIILRQKEFGILDSMNSWLIKKYNPKAGKTGQTKEQKTSKSVPATSEEIKSSIIYKLFPTIDPSESDYVDSDKLKSFKTSGLKDKSFLMKCIEKIVWLYEKESSDITGLSEKDIKGNIYVYSLDSILNNETVILNTGPKNNSALSKKMPDFFWDIEINLRTGEGDVWAAGD
jgi:hypothetical protein